MNNKKSLIAVGILVIGAIAVLIFDRGGNPKSHARVGTSALSQETLLESNGFKIAKGDRTLTLSKSESGMWTVSDDATSIPADAKKIANTLDQLSKIKVQRMVSKTPSDDQGFGVGTSFFLGDGAEPALLFGDKRTGGGQYIQFNGSSEVFLTNEAAELSSDLDSWELKTLVDMKKDEVKSVEFASSKKGQSPTILSRDKAEDKLVVQGLGKSEKTRESGAASVEGAMEALTYSRRLDPSNEEAKTALSNGQSSKFTLFDGRTYSVIVGKVGKDGAEKYFVRIQADKTDTNLDGQKSADIELLNDLMGKWAFEFSPYNAKRLIKERTELVEADKS